jgi:hypothetical protein
MTKKEKASALPGTSYTFALILLVFLILVVAVSLYYRQRLKTIDGQLKQTSFNPVRMKSLPTDAVLLS